MYRFGATPPKRSWLRFSRYQHGGGAVGNVPRGTLSVLKTSIPYVSQVVNREAALGGRDAQSLDDARLRAPTMLRTRTRAVTAEDYEYLALQVPGVARAHCLAPGVYPAGPNDVQPGQVVVLVLPMQPESNDRPTADDLELTPELRGGSPEPPRRPARAGRNARGARAPVCRGNRGSHAARARSERYVRRR